VFENSCYVFAVLHFVVHCTWESDWLVSANESKFTLAVVSETEVSRERLYGSRSSAEQQKFSFNIIKLARISSEQKVT
jgi:hypothetical protein